MIELLSRMRGGDRAAAGRFLTTYGSRIRRRIRGKLSPAMRRVFDSQDILSTLGRRLDQFVRSRRVAAATEAELWALVFRIADNAIVDKARVFRRLQRVEHEDGDFARELSGRLRRAERQQGTGVELEIGRVIEAVDDDIDREILCLWLTGIELRAIAEHLGMNAPAVRKRWQNVKAGLHRRLGAEMLA